MKLVIRDDSKNYTAQVIKLPAKQKVEKLNNLVEVSVFGNSCLVGKDSPEDELYLFFPSGTQLSADFLSKNNLFRDSQLNVDQTQKGFFELNGRVKAIKFQGVTSTGFVIPVLSLIDGPFLNEGDEFNELNGTLICQKYFVPGPTQGEPKGDKVSKINNKLVDLLVPNQFRLHSETEHLAKHLSVLNPNDIVVFTDKEHGSSCILSKVLIQKRLNIWQKFLNLIGGQITTKQYGGIYSSGKPKSGLPKGVEGSWINNNTDYYNTNIWKRAYNDHKHALEDGISLYGELVGFTESGQYIQKGYDYGCDATKGEYKFTIYRITYTKPDGNTIEFSWQQIKDYCAKYNLTHAKEFYFGRLDDWADTYVWSWTTVENREEKIVSTLQNSYNMEKTCQRCTTGVPAEGIVVRIDGKQRYSAYKLKAKAFLKKESDDLDNNETNIEDTN